MQDGAVLSFFPGIDTIALFWLLWDVQLPKEAYFQPWGLTASCVWTIWMGTTVG